MAGLILVCALMCLCSGVISSLARLQSAQPPPTSQLAPSVRTATATPKPAPTATPSGPHIVEAAIIGGTLDDFKARYGTPTYKSTVPWFYYSTPDGLSVGLCFCTTDTGTDGKARLELFGIHPESLVTPTWTEAQGMSAAKALMPPDAVYVRDINDPEVGTIHVYQSADLAATFPAADFYDSNGGGALPPGTFSVACAMPGNPGCSIGTGT